ncbi:unnamed protein product [Caenorhabditis auriculariae]|uniref:Uncharacterized protein n=1 Tax=Caenorhabditis auriculariae TaxID=2777116 RepID=A0A8S1GV44_9PELO|nr:unnamed protein product [Caenorhabditis auriculariae]
MVMLNSLCCPLVKVLFGLFGHIITTERTSCTAQFAYELTHIFIVRCHFAILAGHDADVSSTMDDLLSVALCEAGLEEFVCQPSPISSRSSSYPDDRFSSAPCTSNADQAFDDHQYSNHAPQDEKRNEYHEGTASTSGETNGDCLEAIEVDVSDNPKIEDPVPESVEPPRAVQNVSLNATEKKKQTLSPAMTPKLPTSVRQQIIQRPSNGVVASPGSMSPSTSSSTAVSTIGPIIKRTIHTRNGIQTQYLKPYINEQGQKIFRALNSLPNVATASRGEGTVVRPTSVNGHERVVLVRQDTANGPYVYRKVISTPTRMLANGQQAIIRNAGGAENVISPMAAARKTYLSRGNVVRPGQRGAYATRPGYRLPPLVGRSTGGATMAQHQQQQRFSYATQRNAANSPTMVRPQNSPNVRYANRGGIVPQRSALHASQSSPSFQYASAPNSPALRQMEHLKTPSAVNLRHQQLAAQNQSASMKRFGRNSGGGFLRMMGGVANAGMAESAGAFDNVDINNGRVMLGGAMRGQAGQLSPALLSRTGLPPQPFSPQPQTKSQKAKDEMKQAMMMAAAEQQVQRRNELEEDEENLGYAETYADYTPAKLRSGLAHPDSVVESASLSSVSPPDVRYQISIPEYLIDMGHISALQLEAVIYACQMHERRMPTNERYGYLIGDGAGVGKGRTVACIIFENYLQGRKRAVWLSVSSDLKFDAERDLRDVGAPNIPVFALNKMKYAKISSKENGSIKKGVLFATYTSLIGECRASKSRKYRSRIKQLIQWFGVDYDGVIILDECHRAKNLVPTAGAKPTKTGRIVLELQKALPNARVVYASATGATEPRNMAYMTRLGLWGEGQAFPEFAQFIGAVERRGVGAMEIVAMDMKQRGLYLARQLSFRGVSFHVQEVQLSPEFTKMYDDAVKLWMECRRQFQAVIEALDDEERISCKQIWGQFWACHQRFFKYLCIAAKVDACVKLSREAIKAKKCVVIGLQSTGESATLETLEEMGGELNEFVSTAKAVFYGLIDKHFPTEASLGRDIFKDFDRMYDEFDRPAKRKKTNYSGALSFMDDLGFGSWSGATVGMSGSVGRAKKEGTPEANSTTSESSEDSDKSEDDDDTKSWDSAREEAEGGVTMDQMEEDEWVKALLAEAESSSGSDDEDDDEEADNGEVKKEEAEETEEQEEEQNEPVLEEEFNPFMCDFTNNDPWANNQQIVDDERKPKTKKKSAASGSRKRKHAEEEDSEAQKERAQRQAHRREKKARRARRKLEREKKRREELAKERGNANEFISSSKFCSTEEDDRKNINPMIVKAELLAAVERLGPQLPANTLDQLIDELGGPEFVAEMTGRRGHLITTEGGDVTYQRRNANAEVSLELINMEEKDKFMRGEKLIAIISEAASSGISLQSDKRAQNQRRRVHITLELPWSADKAIQQFGRTHRSNQVSAPEYVFLISELAGEKRFASVVAKRLESLGALTHGDRRATETRDLSQFNMDNKYGRAALDVLLRTVIGTLNPPLIAPPSDYHYGDFFEDMRLYMEGVGLLAKSRNGEQYVVEKEAATIPKFLNRILGLPVHAQNAIFSYFSDIVAELIAQSKHDGTYDTGIMDLGTGGDQVRKLETRIFLGRVDNGSFRVEMHKIGVERGVSWDDAYALYKEHSTDEDGFYSYNPGVNSTGKKVAALIYGIGKIRMDNGARLYAITRPSTGRSAKLLTMADISKRYTKTTPEEAKEIWEEQYEGSSHMCQHNYAFGKCKTETSGVYCETGRRTRTYFVLSGSVLSVWPIVEEVLSGGDRKASRMQIIRVRTEQEHKIVGLLVLPSHVRNLVTQLEAHCGRSIVKSDE